MQKKTKLPEHAFCLRKIFPLGYCTCNFNLMYEKTTYVR